MLNVNLLRAAMAEVGKTQSDLAKAIGVSENTVSASMTGKRSFTVDEVDRICDCLQIYDGAKKSQIFLAHLSQ